MAIQLQGSRILVRVPNWIGDAVMCTPALLSLRRIFPQAWITALARPSIAELLRGHPGINEMLVYDQARLHYGMAGKWRLVRLLKGCQFDMAILLQNAFEAALLALLAGIPTRYGYATDGRGVLLSHSVTPPKEEPMCHQVEYFQHLIDELGEAGDKVSPVLIVATEEEEEICHRLKNLGIREDDLLIGVNPGSVYGTAKRWLPERFAESVDRLVRLLGMQDGKSKRVRCVIVGGPGEEELGESLARAMQINPVVFSGKTSLRELMAIIKRCGLFLTNDTGPMHIASAFGIPLVAIFGPTDHRTTSPYRQPYGLVKHPVLCSPCLLRACPIDHRCMTGVTVEEVVTASLKQFQLGLTQNLIPDTPVL